MDGDNNLNQYMNQSPKIDFKSIDEMVTKNTKLFEKQQKEYFKKLESEIETEKKNYLEEDKLNKLKEDRQKEIQILEDKQYKDKKEKIKKDNEELEKLKDSNILKLIPESLKNFGNKNNNTGEQKNIGEEVIRVSFNPEGIKILKTLLEPIYTALNASMDALNKNIKELIDSMSGNNGSSGIIGLLMMALPTLMPLVMKFLSDVVLVATKIKNAFVWLFELPGKIKTAFSAFFEELKLAEKFTKFIKNPLTQLLDDIKLEVKGISRALKSEEAAASFISNINKIKNSIKSFLRLEEMGAWLSAAWNERIIKPITQGLDRLNSAKTIIGGWVDNILNLFKAEGRLSGISRFFESIMGMLRSTLGYIRSFEGPLARFLSIFRPFVGLFKFLARILSVPVMAAIDGTISAVKTLFSIWNDVDLDPFQKFIAVFTSFIGGLLDIIPNLTSLLAKGLTGIFSWATGKGWKPDNAVSEFLDQNINDQGGVGQVISKKYIGLAKDANKGTLIDDSIAGLKSMFGFGTTKPSYKESSVYRDLSPEQQKEMDEKYEREQKPSPLPNPVNQKPEIIQQNSESAQKFEPIPQNIKNPTVDKLDEMIKNQNKLNEKLIESFTKTINQISSKEKPYTLINNQNTTTQSSDTSNSYLLKPVFDINNDKREQWWKNSREYSATL